jgi:hypothetical protein
MRTSVRVTMLLFALLALALGLGFYVQFSWATNLWPWPDSYLSYIFVSSYATAVGAAILWVAFSGSLGAAKGGFINLTVASAGMGTYLFLEAQTDPAVQPFIIFCGVAVLSFVVAYWVIRRSPIQDQRPTPLLVRISFLLFTAMLIFTGVSLLLKSPSIFPWALRPETSVMFGWAFLGAACYFAYGALYARWDNAGGQLLGFLGYDLILIVPFLRHFADVTSDHLLSLIVYVIFIVYSGALAIYYLFINRSTRRWALVPQAAQSAMGVPSQAAPLG